MIGGGGDAELSGDEAGGSGAEFGEAEAGTVAGVVGLDGGDAGGLGGGGAREGAVADFEFDDVLAAGLEGAGGGQDGEGGFGVERGDEAAEAGHGRRWGSVEGGPWLGRWAWGSTDRGVVLAGGDGARQWLDDAGDDAGDEQLFADLALVAERVEEGDSGAVAPILADGEMDGDGLVGEVAGADVVGGGAGFERESALESAGVFEGEGDRGFEVEDAVGRGVDEGFEGVADAEGLGDDFVVVAGVVEVEAVGDVEGFAVEGADGEEVGGQFEEGFVEVVGVVEGGGVDVSGGEAAGFDGDPAVGGFVFVAFEDEVAAFADEEVGEIGEGFFHLFEEVEHGIAGGGEFHLGVEAEVDEEFVGLVEVTAHAGPPEWGRLRGVGGLGERGPVGVRPDRVTIP